MNTPNASRLTGANPKGWPSFLARLEIRDDGAAREKSIAIIAPDEGAAGLVAGAEPGFSDVLEFFATVPGAYESHEWTARRAWKPDGAPYVVINPDGSPMVADPLRALAEQAAAQFGGAHLQTAARCGNPLAQKWIADTADRLLAVARECLHRAPYQMPPAPGWKAPGDVETQTLRPALPLKWWAVPCRVECEGDTLEAATVFVRCAEWQEAQARAVRHVHDTWGTADNRIDYLVKNAHPEEQDETDPKFFGRPGEFTERAAKGAD